MNSLPSRLDDRSSDEWYDFVDRDGQTIGQFNPATRVVRPQADTPDHLAATQLLPPAFQPTVSVGQAGQVTPLAYVTLVNHQMAANAAEVDREIARQEIRRRHTGKPLRPLWQAVDNLRYDQELGRQMQQVHRQTLTQLTQLHAQQQGLVSAMAEGLIDGTALTYQQSRLVHEHQEREFARSLEADNQDRAHAYRMAELSGEQRLAELKLQIEYDQDRQTQAEEHALVAGLLDSWAQIPATIAELDYLKDGDSSAYIHAMIGSLTLIDHLLAEYADIDPEKRSAALAQLLKMGAPSIWNNVQGFLTRQTRVERHQARQGPVRRTDPVAAD